MFSIKGKVVFLTGALGGIGRCFVKELLKNEAKGIALVDINNKVASSFQKEMSSEFGDHKTVFMKADLQDPSQIEMAYEKTISHFKQLDIVINNAGIFSEDNYLKCLQANFVATAYSTHLAFRKYLQPNRISEEAIVINIASIAGLYPFPIFPAYSPCKQGIVTLGRCFGHEAHSKVRNIRIMTICPGPTNTALLDQLPDFPDDIKEMTLKVAKTFNIQKPENVATALIHLIQNGKSGSVWVVKADKPAEEIDWTTIDEESRKNIY